MCSETSSSASLNNKTTIVAQATPPGRGGVGIVRVSGPDVKKIIAAVICKSLQPRYAHYVPFQDSNGEVIDIGLALFFPGPDSFTGEDVLELHGHGGPIVINMLIKTICQCGAQLARPGEFSERAFLNDKMDLTQAEAIADLIDSGSEQAARSAVRSLQGEFSKQVNELTEALIKLRIYVEASIDFPEEEVDFLAEGKVLEKLDALMHLLEIILQKANQGHLLQEGMNVVIAGKPNAGKSSLLNALSGKETAIVTDIPGTTRDILRENIHIDGMPLHIMDTAGLHDSEDYVEQLGVKRALQVISEADKVLIVVDAKVTPVINPQEITAVLGITLSPERTVFINNKIDLTGQTAGIVCQNGQKIINICAKTGAGIEEMKQYLKDSAGFAQMNENSFTARRRHLEALRQTQHHLLKGKEQLTLIGAGELLAEDLRMAQQALGEVTGTFSNDDLLGQIFSSFCIGK